MQNWWPTFSTPICMDSPYEDTLGNGMREVAEDSEYIEVVVVR